MSHPHLLVVQDGILLKDGTFSEQVYCTHINETSNYEDFRTSLQNYCDIPRHAKIYCVNEHRQEDFYKRKEGFVVDSQERLLKLAKFAVASKLNKQTIRLICDRSPEEEHDQTSGACESELISSVASNMSAMQLTLRDIAQKLEKLRLEECKNEIDANECSLQVDEQTSLENAELKDRLGNENTLPQLHCDTTPPAWFKEYMDLLKTDIVKEVSNEVIKNVLEVLNKHPLESSIPVQHKELGRSPDHKQSTLSNRCNPHYQLCVQSEFKKKLRATKEGRIADARHKTDKKLHDSKGTRKRGEDRMGNKRESKAERLHEKKRKIVETKMPSSQFIETMNNLNISNINQDESDKKVYNTKVTKAPEDILRKMEKKYNRQLEHLRERMRMIKEKRSTVRDMKLSCDLVTVTMNNLDKDSNGHITHIPQSSTQESVRPQRSPSLSDKQLRCLHDEKRQIIEIIKTREDTLKKMDRESERQVACLSEKERIIANLKISCGLLPESVHNSEEGNRQGNIDNIASSTVQIFGSQTNISFVPPSSSCEHHEMLNDEDRSNAPSNADRELCASCFATDHETLDNTDTNAFITCSPSKNDDISICSDSNISELNDEEKFEVLQVPPDSNSINQSGFTKEGRGQNADTDSLSGMSDIERLEYEDCDNYKKVNDDSNRESPSFEILSETHSPPVSIYVNEDHFSTTETVFPTMNINRNDVEFNPKSNTLYVVDVNGRVYNEVLTDDSEECPNTELEERKGGRYSFIAETLLSNYKNPSLTTESVDTERGSISAYDFNMDVKSSHTTYPMNVEKIKATRVKDTPLERSYQSQTDFGDFAQSFHSHTTSMTSNDIRRAGVPSQHMGTESTTHVEKNPKLSKGIGVIKAQRHTNEMDKTNQPNQQIFGTGSEPIQILPEALMNKVARAAIATSGNWRGICDKLRSLTAKPARSSSGGVIPEYKDIKLLPNPFSNGCE